MQPTLPRYHCVCIQVASRNKDLNLMLSSLVNCWCSWHCIADAHTVGAARRILVTKECQVFSPGGLSGRARMEPRKNHILVAALNV